MNQDNQSNFDISRDPIDRGARAMLSKPISNSDGIPITELSRSDLAVPNRRGSIPRRRSKGKTVRDSVDNDLRKGASFRHVRVLGQRDDHYFLWECVCDCGHSLIIERSKFLNGQELCKFCRDTGILNEV